jgi:hypothetical protein
MPPFQCQKCGKPVPFDEPIPRDSECEGCRRDLRCCLNCRHYDSSRNNACRETEAELVEDKARRNFCEFFSFNRAPFVVAQGQAMTARAAQARVKFDGLFGGTPKPANPAADAKKRFDDLFKKPE